MSEQKAVVFSVERFAIHDGQGLRTTVFFKGCPLHCAWCHNPEGISRQRQVLYRRQDCIHCGNCQGCSEAGGIESIDGNIQVNRQCPEHWADLLDNCPSGALCWDSRQVSVGQLLVEVLRDEAFFRHGGGVTVSGGEPLLQAEFVQVFLRRLRQKGIHTAMESSLHAPRSQLVKVLPELDQLYADCKLFDSAQHRYWTGHGNEQILNNIRWLLQSDFRERVVIRTPMIPGITAESDNIAAIAGFLSKCWPDVHYELLNYNPLAPAKYPQVGKVYWFQKNSVRYSRAEMEERAALARAQGLTKVTIDE